MNAAIAVDLPDEDLRSQLFSYAQDISALINAHADLQQRYQSLLQEQGRGSMGGDLFLAALHREGVLSLVSTVAGEIVGVEASVAQLLGQSEQDLRGRHIAELVSEDMRPVAMTILKQIADGSGNLGIVQAQLALVSVAGTGCPQQLPVLVMPIQLHDQLDIHWMFQPDLNWLYNSDYGVLQTDMQGIICQTNIASSKITGYELAELSGLDRKLLYSGRHSADFLASYQLHLQDFGSWSGEFFNRRKDGHIYPAWKTVKAVRDLSGQTMHYLTVFVDASQRDAQSEQLSRLAFHDPLTGLPNRRQLEDRLQLAITQAQHDEASLAVLFIDLDKFKPINDDYGHEIGDLVLKQLAQRLRKSVRLADTVARVGGDEFVVVLRDTTRVADIERVACNLIAALSKPIEADVYALQVGVSIGCARFPQDGTDMLTLINRADTAMYQSKRDGGSRFCLYRGSEISESSCQIDHEIGHALARKQMQLVYQPQVGAGVEPLLTGCEALLRWRHPVLGDVDPASFVPIAEKNGAIIQLGDWVLEQVCMQHAAWAQAGWAPSVMTINMSVRQLRDPGFVNRVERILKTHRMVPGVLEFDLSEFELLHTLEDCVGSLQELRRLGIKIAIHDFGASYVGLTHLTALPLDRIKLDRRIVNRVASSQVARACSLGVLGFGQTAQTDLLACGVEDMEQWSLLTEQGYPQLQGNLSGQPMLADDFLAWVKAGRCGMRAADEHR